jgi:hypothetical protein
VCLLEKHVWHTAFGATVVIVMKGYGRWTKSTFAEQDDWIVFALVVERFGYEVNTGSMKAAWSRDFGNRFVGPDAKCDPSL